MRFSKWMGVSALLAILLVLSAHASNVTGTELFAECSASYASVARVRCDSYIAGVVDGVDTLIISLRLLHPFNGAYPKLYCLPPRTAAKSLVSPIVHYLRDHPSTRHYEASSEVLLALEQAYPCRGI